MKKNKKMGKGKINDLLDPDRHSEKVSYQGFADALAQEKAINQNIINECSAPEKPSPMLMLRKILEPDLYSSDHPKVRFEEVAVRADAIDIVEAATYDSAYMFVDNSVRDGVYSRLRSEFGPAPMWRAIEQAPCVRIHVFGGHQYLVEGTVQGLNDRIKRRTNELE